MFYIIFVFLKDIFSDKKGLPFKSTLKKRVKITIWRIISCFTIIVFNHQCDPTIYDDSHGYLFKKYCMHIQKKSHFELTNKKCHRI